MSDELLKRFVETFLRGLELEMESVRGELEEVRLPLHSPRQQDDLVFFDCRKGVEKLFVGQGCSLLANGRRTAVTIEEVQESKVVLKSDEPLDLKAPDFALEVVPWFLYEKMEKDLKQLLEPEHPYQAEMALRTFAKLPSQQLEFLPVVTGPDLNDAQRGAVEKALGHQLSFLWGPPGTGKTTTLACLLVELLRNERRILVVSNTNTALDQALWRLKHHPDTADLVSQGAFLRLGQTLPDEPCSVTNVIRSVYRSLVTELAQLRAERSAWEEWQRLAETALEKLRKEVEPEQLDLFGGGGEGLSGRELRELVPAEEFERLAGLEAKDQMEFLLALSQQRLERGEACRVRIGELRQTLKESRESIVSQARVVFSTLASLNVHPMLEGQTFDTVVLEEAGMAVLPAVFLAAARARLQVVVVGDPRQLPSILSSRNAAARKILGRSIFEVAVPDPTNSELVAMLDTQYRMCPEIGDLVSQLFYDGNLRNAACTTELAAKTARQPFPGRGVTVVDLAGKSRCLRPSNSRSRYNEESAEVAVAVARRALEDQVESVAIITPYREQVRCVERLLRQENLDDERVTCSTVHRFQGHERELVVVDTVDAPPLEPGILLCGEGPDSASAQLLNVSISRAQAKLILLAEFRYLVSRRTGVLGDLLKQAAKSGQVVRVALQKKVAPKAPVGGTGSRSDWD